MIFIILFVFIIYSRATPSCLSLASISFWFAPAFVCSLHLQLSLCILRQVLSSEPLGESVVADLETELSRLREDIERLAEAQQKLVAYAWGIQGRGNEGTKTFKKEQKRQMDEKARKKNEEEHTCVHIHTYAYHSTFSFSFTFCFFLSYLLSAFCCVWTVVVISAFGWMSPYACADILFWSFFSSLLCFSLCSSPFQSNGCEIDGISANSSGRFKAEGEGPRETATVSTGQTRSGRSVIPKATVRTAHLERDRDRQTWREMERSVDE